MKAIVYAFDCDVIVAAILVHAIWTNGIQIKGAAFSRISIDQAMAGGAELIARLKAAGHYPYSDLDREPVV